MTQFPQSMRTLKPGALLLKRYEIIKSLGVGSVGTTYLARDRELARSRIALKVLHPNLFSSADSLNDLRSRIAKVRTLSHPNICRCYDLFELPNGLWALAIEYVSGCSLAELTKNTTERLSRNEALHILCKFSHALEFAHRHGIVHGNLHPKNILFDRSGNLKISDFMINSSVSPELGLNRSRTLLGIPRYQAPEQLCGEIPETRTDIFSYSVMAAEMLGATNPLTQNTSRTSKRNLIEDLKKQFSLDLREFDFPQDLAQSEIAQLIHRGLSADTKSRTSSLSDFSTCLENLLGPSNSAQLDKNLASKSANLLTERDFSNWRPYRVILILLSFFAAFSGLTQEKVKARIFTVALVAEDLLEMDFSPVYLKLGFPDLSQTNPEAIFEAAVHPQTWLLRGGLDVWYHQDKHKSLNKNGDSLLEFMIRTISAEDRNGGVIAETLHSRIGILGLYSYDPIEFGHSNDLELMHRLVRSKNAGLVKIIARYYPSLLNSRDSKSRTALDLAAEQNFREGVIYLLEASNRNCSIDPHSGRSAMHWAASRGAIETLQILRDYGCITSLEDSDGKSPISHALLTAPDISLPLTLQILRGESYTPSEKELNLAKGRKVESLLTNYDHGN